MENAIIINAFIGNDNAFGNNNFNTIIIAITSEIVIISKNWKFDKISSSFELNLSSFNNALFKTPADKFNVAKIVITPNQETYTEYMP